MARSARKAPDAPGPTPTQEPAPAEPTTEPETTTDYTRRAGGYVLTQRGWVLEK